MHRPAGLHDPPADRHGVAFDLAAVVTNDVAEEGDDVALTEP
jgi:hypothetical protein